MRKFNKVLLTAVVLFAAMSVFVAPAQASNGIGQETLPAMDLMSFLQWLVGGGGAIIAVSWLLERMPWFQKLSSSAKDYMIFGSSVIVGCGALAIVTYAPPETLSAIEPYFLIISSTFILVFIAKAFHQADKLI